MADNIIGISRSQDCTYFPSVSRLILRFPGVNICNKTPLIGVITVRQKRNVGGREKILVFKKNEKVQDYFQWLLSISNNTSPLKPFTEIIAVGTPDVLRGQVPFNFIAFSSVEVSRSYSTIIQS